MKKLTDLTQEEKVNAMLKWASNKQENDKYALAYLLNMLDRYYSHIVIFCDSYSRQDIWNRFRFELNVHNVDKLICSEYTKAKIEKYANK